MAKKKKKIAKIYIKNKAFIEGLQTMTDFYRQNKMMSLWLSVFQILKAKEIS